MLRSRRSKPPRICSALALETRRLLAGTTIAEVEPNDSPAAASAIVMGTTEFNVATGDIATQSDLDYYKFTLGQRSGVFLNVDIFPQTFCQDLPPEVGAVMAVSQRPAALATLGEPSGPPSRKKLPSWYLVASSDRVIPPAAERAMAARAGSTTVEIDSSHVAMISHPDEVADLITQAIAAVG